MPIPNPLRSSVARLSASLLLLLSALPVSAQTVETFVLSVGGISIGTGCSTFTTPSPVLSFFGSQGIAEPVPGYAPCSIGGGMTDQLARIRSARASPSCRRGMVSSA